MSMLHVVILAAGKGTRMKSSLPKVAHLLAGRPVIDHVVRAGSALAPTTTTVVVGHGADEVRRALGNWPDAQFVVQSPQLGTGHALLQAESVLAGRKGTVLLLYGDVPLLTTTTLQRLLEHHRGSRAALTVLTTELDDPYGYGRIVREKGRIARIVEERDASSEERAIHEINSGIYAIEVEGLFEG